jgi:hypothetical protein
MVAGDAVEGVSLLNVLRGGALAANARRARNAALMKFAILFFRTRRCHQNSELCQTLDVAVGETQREFAAAAARDGIVLVRQSMSWLNERGHLGLPDDDERRATRQALEHIYLALGGDLATLDAGRSKALPGDFVHEATGTLVEVDESQHFTSFRLQTLELYPVGVPLGFDPAAYRRLCETWRERSDGYYRTKAARGFGVGGRQRQRAYYDALRDLATPAMGRPSLIRIEAADREPADAYRRHRDTLRAALLG